MPGTGFCSAFPEELKESSTPVNNPYFIQVSFKTAAIAFQTEKLYHLDIN